MHTTFFCIMASIKYLLPQKSDYQWGIITCTVGLQDVPAGSKYPLGDHPEGYLFFADRGRVLRETQILYITDGGGWFVSAHHERTHLRAGDIVVLYPGEWHNYAPDPQTGWSEAWIGFTGSLGDMLIAKALPDRSHPVHHVGISDTLMRAFEKAVEIAEGQQPAHQQQLAGYIGLIISTTYAKDRQLPYLQMPDRTAINSAIKLLRQNLHSSLRMEDVAAQAGMGYSKFRKTFKAYTGYSPAQYFLRLKMERAKDYLQSTSLSCKEIAYRLGFDSSSHFNKMFRLSQNQTPAEYRRGDSEQPPPNLPQRGRT